MLERYAELEKLEWQFDVETEENLEPGVDYSAPAINEELTEE
jgi:hypothetical protein